MDSFDTAGSSLVFGHPLRSTRDATLGALVLGADTPLTPAQNSVVSTAVGLLELLVRQRTSGALAPSQLATALLLHPDRPCGRFHPAGKRAQGPAGAKYFLIQVRGRYAWCRVSDSKQRTA